MTGFVTLLRRELRRRLLPIATGAALGLFVAIVPWLPGMGRHDPAELRAAGALGVALLWALTLAFFEGLGFLARDLGEGRLAFDFRLPAGATAIWAARTLGALGAVAASTGLVLLPSALAGADFWAAEAATRESLERGLLVKLWPDGLWLPVAIALIFVVAHVVSLARATRSPWIAIDLAGCLVFVALSLLALAPLDLWGAREAAGDTLIALGILTALAIFGASWAQVAIGRCEADRAHRPFSLTLAALALLPVLVLAERSASYVAPELGELARPPARASSNASVSPLGWHTTARELSRNWVQVSGYVDGRGSVHFRFALEPATGRWIGLGVGSGLGSSASAAAVSQDGSTLAWVEAGRRRGNPASARLVWVDLTGDRPAEPQRSIEWPHAPAAWGLSPDGRQIATYWEPGVRSSGNGLVQIENRDDGALVRTVRIGGCRASEPLAYLDEDMVRVPCGMLDRRPEDPPTLGAYDVDIRTGAATPNRLARRSWRDPIELGPELVARRGARRVRAIPPAVPVARTAWELVDGNSGKQTILEPPARLAEDAALDFAFLLEDGRSVLAFLSRERHILAVYDTAGRLVSSRELDGAERLWPLGESGGGNAIFVLRDLRERPHRRTTGWDAIRLPLDGGTETVVASELSVDTPWSLFVPQTVLHRTDGEILWIDLVKGTLRPLLDRVLPRSEVRWSASTQAPPAAGGRPST